MKKKTKKNALRAYFFLKNVYLYEKSYLEKLIFSHGCSI